MLCNGNNFRLLIWCWALLCTHHVRQLMLFWLTEPPFATLKLGCSVSSLS